MIFEIRPFWRFFEIMTKQKKGEKERAIHRS